MADIVYTVNQDLPENISGFEQYSEQDKALVSSFQVNSTFNPTKNHSELHILSLADELLESNYDYTSYKQLGNAQSAGQEGASIITIDPIEDAKTSGYSSGGVKLLYHFLDDLYTEDRTVVDFYIQDISADRTEVSLTSTSISQETLIGKTTAIKDNLLTQSYFTGFRLNFKNNDLLIATNIDTLDSLAGKVVVVKLYEPLPTAYDKKSLLSIVDMVSDSVAYEVDSEIIVAPQAAPTLRSPNFNIEIADNSVIPTTYYNYDDLLSYPVNNSNSEIYSTINELGAQISVDYTDFKDFVHFSSAQERLLNFKYKVDLLTSYSASLSTYETTTTGLQGLSGSRDYYQNLTTGILSNFDHYERFLYYESGSSCWPKTNTTKPYINKASDTLEATTWYSDQIDNAIQYDLTNYNSLVYAIPTFLRDDSSNEKYLTFVYMVGQHFDNLWLYSKAVTDKYDADNRIDHGISKDLVGEALRNFGVKLYTSNKSVEDLFTTFIGQSYQSGSEVINHYITGSLTGSNTPIQPSPYDTYQKEIQKRIYHNLPLLLKSKGTERGLRALINCLGVPGDILDIKLYGGRNIQERPFFGDYQYYTSSLDKIRLDNTGSLISGSALSNYVSIVNRDGKYTDDLHAIEVGFSPTDNIDTYIISQSASTFNIDDYLGDPSDQYIDSYSELNKIATTILSGSLGTSTNYDLQDYVRLIKFFDNTVFKMVKDFIPARALADTGIIIKPNLLNRSKAKSPTASGIRPEYTASIDTAFIVGRNAGSFRSGSGEYTTSYEDLIQTPAGLALTKTLHGQEQPKFNGEFDGSKLTLTTGNLTANNPYLQNITATYPYDIYFVSSSAEVCLLGTKSIEYITSSTQLFNYTDFFTFAANCEISSSTTAAPPYTPITFPHSFGSDGYNQYDTFYLTATNTNVTASLCQEAIQLTYGTCNLVNVGALTTVIKYQVGGVADTYNLENWFTTGSSTSANLQYVASWTEGITPYQQVITNPTAYQFTQPLSSPVTITLQDIGLGDMCKISVIVNLSSTGLGTIPTGSFLDNTGINHGLQFEYSSNSPVTINQNLAEFDNPNSTQGCTATTRFVGPAGNTPAGQYTRGIPGYFTPYNNPNYTVGVGQTTRFTAYKVTCLNANERTTSTEGWRGNWHLEEVPNRLNVSAYSLADAYSIPIDSMSPEYEVSLRTYLSKGEKNYPNQFVPGPYQVFVQPTPEIIPPAPYAITFPTSFDTNCAINNTQPVYIPTHELDRAYVIQAFVDGSPDIYQQVTVYGKASSLARISTGETLPLEGVLNAPVAPYLGQQNLPARYVDIWLLKDWDYTNGVPPEQPEPNGIYKQPVAPDPNDTWVKVPIRYFYNPDPTTAFPSFATEQDAKKYVIGQQWGDPV